MLETYGTVRNGVFLRTKSQLTQRENYLRSLKDGTQLTEILKKTRKSKTWEQVKTNYGLALTMIKKTFDERGWGSDMLLNLPNPTGVPITIPLLEIFFNCMFPVNDDDGNRITLRNMTTVQASERFENIRNWSASQWSINIPDPDPNWRDRSPNER